MRDRVARTASCGLFLIFLLAASSPGRPAFAADLNPYFGDFHLHAGNERTRHSQQYDAGWKHSFLPVYETLSRCVGKGLDSCTQTPHGNEVTDGPNDPAASWYGWVTATNGFWTEETLVSGQPYPGGPFLIERNTSGWRLLSDPNQFALSERAYFDDAIAKFNLDHPGFVASPGLEQMALGGHKTWHCPQTPQRCHIFSLGYDCSVANGGATTAYAYARSLGCAVIAAHPQGSASMTNFVPLDQDPAFGFHPHDVTGYELVTDPNGPMILGLFGPPVSGMTGLSLEGALNFGYPLAAVYGSDMHFLPQQSPGFSALGDLAQTGYWAAQNTIADRIEAIRLRRLWYTQQFQTIAVEATTGDPSAAPEAVLGGFLNVASGQSFWLRVDVSTARAPRADDTTWLSVIHNGQAIYSCTKAAPKADCECSSGNSCSLLHQFTAAELPSPAGWLMVVVGDGTAVDPDDVASISALTSDIRGVAVATFVNWGEFSPFFAATASIFPFGDVR